MRMLGPGELNLTELKDLVKVFAYHLILHVLIVLLVWRKICRRSVHVTQCQVKRGRCQTEPEGARQIRAAPMTLSSRNKIWLASIMILKQLNLLDHDSGRLSLRHYSIAT